MKVNCCKAWEYDKIKKILFLNIRYWLQMLFEEQIPFLFITIQSAVLHLSFSAFDFEYSSF
jgi:hypothetical protein